MGLFSLFGNKKKKEDLLELQKNILVNSPDRLIMSEKQLMESATRMAQRDLEIIQDCIRILGETKKPETENKNQKTSLPITAAKQGNKQTLLFWICKNINIIQDAWYQVSGTTYVSGKRKG